MRHALPLALAVVLAAPAGAQTCDSPVGPIESCVVGAWIGSSTIPEAMERAMRAMPENVRANFNDFGRPVAMIIYEDGFFETFPMGANGNAVFEDDDGNVTRVEMNAQTITSAGYLTAMGGMLDICHLPGGAGGLTGEMTVTTSDGSATMPLAPPPGPQSFNPVITYTCSGNSMQQMVALPAPLGTITYDLARVPLSAFPEEMRDRVEDLPTD
ncbi:hypothetical protein [Rhodophyticola porphyridii]|uniref:Uncharacterized protein n=1 Tax=Rhodophyticola porphyridii TaxID=1852017 RepID=A0A3L9YMR0_9RHOB|nr:hypothetical protein [Rhodophyticola porphyridii]RMA44000.1 hypothetical protein D9R08_03560 [Rhodophyticola porphyridii]